MERFIGRGQIAHIQDQTYNITLMRQKFLPFPQPPSSLVWQSDVLVDLVSGGNHYHVDGRFEQSQKRYAYRFDGAVATPDGKYNAVFEHLGTKGALTVANGSLREINRSYYHANLYLYPVALFYLPDGRPAVLHCPECYNWLEIELIDAVECITASNERKPGDFCYSRLEISPSGRYALSVGWIWQPVDALRVFDLHQALENPLHLDEGLHTEYDVSSAAFLDDRYVIMAISSDDSLGQERELLGKSQIEIFDLQTNETAHTVGVDLDYISLLPIDDNFAWDIHKYPKIIDLNTGEVVAECPEVLIQGPVSAICPYKPETHPPYSLHSDRRRLAVGTEEGIVILTFEMG